MANRTLCVTEEIHAYQLGARNCLEIGAEIVSCANTSIFVISSALAADLFESKPTCFICLAKKIKRVIVSVTFWLKVSELFLRHSSFRVEIPSPQDVVTPQLITSGRCQETVAVVCHHDATA